MFADAGQCSLILGGVYRCEAVLTGAGIFEREGLLTHGSLLGDEKRDDDADKGDCSNAEHDNLQSEIIADKTKYWCHQSANANHHSKR